MTCPPLSKLFELFSPVTQANVSLEKMEKMQLSLLDKAEKAHGLDKPRALSRITELCLEQAGVAA